MSRSARRRASLAGIALAAVAAPVIGQAPRYTAAQLACARFTERTDTGIHGDAGGRPRDETGGRFAVWAVRGLPAGDSAVRIEAWLDSLAIWRKSDDSVRSPDTDGIIGGRYRGALFADGRYSPAVKPFVPDEVAEFADLRDAIADLFPALPPSALAPGAVWHGAAGLTIERLGDSTTTSAETGGAAAPIQRYRLARRTTQHEAPLAGADTLTIPIRQTLVEDGEFAWDPVRGLVARSRRITVETDVPSGGAVRVPVRSRVVQRVALLRTADDSTACR